MFRKRLIVAIGSLCLVITLLMGNVVLAEDQRLTFDDLVNMSHEELAGVSQVVLQDALQGFYESGEKEWCQHEENDIRRLMEQWSVNQEQVTRVQIGEKPYESTRVSNLQVGWSTTVSWAEDGDSDYSGWGSFSHDENYSGTLTESYAAAWVVGQVNSWCRTGHMFYVGGSGSAFYRIDMDCAWMCASEFGGTNTLELYVEEWRGGNYYTQSFSIDSHVHALFGYHSDSFEYSTPSYIQLYAGGIYRISLKVETSALAVSGASIADCMHEDSEVDLGASWDYLHLECVS